ncbi:MAG: hypothetical protein WA688_09625 [Thermoplasmata archaeon]
MQQEWNAGFFPYDTVVRDSTAGFVTFPALKRPAHRGVGLLLLDFDGRPILSAVPEHPFNELERSVLLEAYTIPEVRITTTRIVV